MALPQTKIYPHEPKRPGKGRSAPQIFCKKTCLGQTWGRSDKDKFFRQKEIPKNGGVPPFFGD